jgi:DNA polymerase-3 subunit delta'
VADYLTASKRAGPEEARFLAAMSMGSLGTALTVDKALLDMRRRWMDTVATMRHRKYGAALNAAEKLSMDREESLQFLQWLESWYRDLLIYSITGETTELINVDVVTRLAEQSLEYELDSVLELMRLTLGATARIQRNVNRRMVFEDLLLTAVEAR